MRWHWMICAGLAACTQFPEVDVVQTPGIDRAPYPDLVPIETLLSSDAPRATPEIRAEVEARAAGLQGRTAAVPSTAPDPALAARTEALRARAAALSSDIVDVETRTRMQRGVAPVPDDGGDAPAD